MSTPSVDVSALNRPSSGSRVHVGFLRKADLRPKRLRECLLCMPNIVQ